MSSKAGIRCFFCDRTIDTEILQESPIELAEQKGWTVIIINGDLAFICPHCQRLFSFCSFSFFGGEGVW